MRNLLIAALASGALSATPLMAHSAPPSTGDTSAMPTHEMCKSVMGHQMDPRHPHDHGRDKTGAATWPNGKPLTKAEMARMHETCAKRMAEREAAAPKPDAPK